MNCLTSLKAIKNRTIRYTTFLKEYGPVSVCDRDTPAETMREWFESGRLHTVYHDEEDWCAPVEITPRHVGYVNKLCYLVTEKPVADNVVSVIGCRSNAELFALCNK